MIRKSASYLVLLISLCVGGCTTTAYVSKTLDDASLGLSIKSIKTGGVWSTGEPGHGLKIYVCAESDGSRYQRNLDLELDGAAKVCAALAESYRVLEWAYIDVYYFNTYQRMSNDPHRVVGVAEVIIRRETWPCFARIKRLRRNIQGTGVLSPDTKTSPIPRIFYRGETLGDV